ncbi:VOC family protein [uncultured Meiothermus sp.]|jgi:catechol 2,3-dioxygenase-like lactoylglutathione lyase family enzyme|uniref:VOC family protein n=1 Tax=uncultured Meiothermus sp. TaxID=157471 RepID=UPI00261BB74A|nr:VOC family protein [uncultured Meiothermus sp.]
MPNTETAWPRDRWGLKAPFAAVHHVALVTNDMRKTVAFYRDVLGAEVAMSHRLPGGDGRRHYFITVAPNAVLAFFENPEAEPAAYQPPIQPKSGRALDHIAFFVEDDAALEAWYARLRGRVDNLSEIKNLQGMVRAFFFSDPNGIVLEVMAETPKGFDFPSLDDPDPAY